MISHDNGARVNVVSGRWHTPLQAAAHAADLDCITELLKAGADPRKSTPGGYYGSPLAAAAYSGNLECLKSLLDAGAGAQVDQIGGEFGFPLQAAAIAGNIECLKTLLEIANVNARGGKYDSAIQAAASQANAYECVKLLIEHGADLLRTGGEYGSVMQAAAVGGNADSWNLLVDHGADMFAVGGKYGTAFQASALKGRDNMITPLLNCQGERIAINARGGKYETALQAAAFADRHDIVTMLLEHGASASVQGGYYGSALTAAAIRNCPDLLALILDQPLPDSMLDHAFLQAVMHRKEQAIDLLLKSGASVEARDNGRSAWNLLDIDAIADDNSDIGDDFVSDESQTVDESSDSGDNVVAETDTSAADDTDDDASKASLELGETVTEQSRILRMLNEAKAQLKKHPDQKRIYPPNHKVYREEQATAGAPQAGSRRRNGNARGVETSNAESLKKSTGAPNSVPLYANSGSQDFAGGNPSVPAPSGLFSTISNLGKSFRGQGESKGSGSPTTAQYSGLGPSALQQTRNLPIREPEAEQSSDTYGSSYGQRSSNDHQSGYNAYNADRQQREFGKGPGLDGEYSNDQHVPKNQPTETSRYASNTDVYGNANQPSNSYQHQDNNPPGGHLVNSDLSDDEPNRVMPEKQQGSDNDGEEEHGDQEEGEDDDNNSPRLAAQDDDDDGLYNPAQKRNQQAQSEEDNDDQDESEANNDTQSEAQVQEDPDDNPQGVYHHNDSQTSEDGEPDDTDEQDADDHQEPEADDDDDDEPSTSYQPQEKDDEPSTSYHQPQEEEDDDDDDDEPQQQTYNTQPTYNNNSSNEYESPPQQSSSNYDGAEAVDAALQKAKEKAKKFKFWK